MTNNAKNNGKQRKSKRSLGGVTGRGFMPGKSGNPKGRPRSRGLLNALKAAVEEVGADGRNVEEQVVDALIEEALRGRHRLPAIQTIFDRLEGRPRQQLEIKHDELGEFTSRSNADLEYYIAHGRFPQHNNSSTDKTEGDNL